MLKVFMSYSDKDKALAGALKDRLIVYGLDVFLAHDDIEPTEEWEEVILEQLRECDVFVALLTSNYTESQWTDQEAGFALAGGKLIIPLRVDLNPYGFIGRLQALPVGDDLGAVCRSISQAIAKRPKHREQFLDGLVESFAQSFSFKEAGDKAELLLQYEGYTPHQIQSVLLAALNNDQITHSFRAQSRLLRFIELHGSAVSSELVEKVREAISSASGT